MTKGDEDATVQRPPLTWAEKTGWPPKLGMHTVMAGHWVLTVEGGFGDLTSAMFMLGYKL